MTSHRLTQQAEFTRVMGGGAKAVSANFFLLLAKLNEEPKARLGMVVSKKAYRRANKRNRLKRLIRESFRQHHEMLPHIDVVVLAKKGHKDVDNSQIFNELNLLWKDLCGKFARSSGG